jgi:hypothetical protein
LSSRHLAIWVIAALAAAAAAAAMSASAAVSAPPPHGALRSRAVPSGSAHLYAVGTRSLAQRQSAASGKLDAMLADLARHAGRARPDQQIADLHSLSPAARFSLSRSSGAALVLVDAVTLGDPEKLESALARLGLERAARYANDVGGWLPVDQLETAAARAEVLSIRAAMPRTASTGPVSTQGDYAQATSVVRASYPSLTGAGVSVGVLSDSFNCYAVYAAPGSGVPASGFEGYAYNGFTADYATDVSTDALPTGVSVLEEADCLNYGAPAQTPFSDEGRAMLQIVHAVAPGAALAFYTADNSEADFANGITRLAAGGARVIADDVTYFDEPYYQDGIVAEAVNTVEAQGVAYFTAAGNNSALSHENTAPSFATLSASGPTAGEYLLNFDTSGHTTTNDLPVSVPAMQPGELLAVVVEWDQPYVTGAPGSGGATSQLDLCVTGASGVTITDYDGNAVSCTGPNALGADPFQVLIISNPANAAGNSAAQSLQFSLGLANGTKAPGRIILSVEDDGLGSSITQFATHSATIQGHHNAAGAGTVGAAFYFTTPRCGTTPAQLEPYSSEGGAPILFSDTGTRLATPVLRQKPDFVGPDGVNNTFLGFTLVEAGITGSDGLLSTGISECQNNPDYPNFFGTSAATPHAASIAALILQANAAATPTEIYTALQTSALPMAGPTPNATSGYGFIQADAALALIAPGPPTLTLAPSTLVLGNSTTLTWSSVNTTGCTASGSWSGALAASGSKMIQPTAIGSDAYSLSCSNAGGSSSMSTATLTVNGVPTGGGGGGGGGALDGLSILGLAWLLRSRRLTRHHGGEARGA